jgi:hypothetical protein
MDASANAIAGLQDHAASATIDQLEGSRQTRESGTHDDGVKTVRGAHYGV